MVLVRDALSVLCVLVLCFILLPLDFYDFLFYTLNSASYAIMRRFIDPVQLKIFHASDHDIDPSQIDDDAVYVLKKLREAGFLAFLVGGSVRDLLLKKTPKDFDISTSAKPEEIKAVFQRQCLLIGRRFRLAHIRFKHKIIEVSTFRSGENESDLILHDNIWGTPEEDVLRRDFTINGLFYDPVEHVVIDYVGGWNDIHKHTLRTIGNPVIRFKQDPVRMIRLLKFKARFGFHVDAEAERALDLCCEEILKSSQARVLEEIMRMLESGASEPFFRLMHQKGVIELLFPCLKHFLDGSEGEKIYQLLEAADRLNLKSERRPLDRAILAACLFFPDSAKRAGNSLCAEKNHSPPRANHYSYLRVDKRDNLFLILSIPSQGKRRDELYLIYAIQDDAALGQTAG